MKKDLLDLLMMKIQAHLEIEGGSEETGNELTLWLSRMPRYVNELADILGLRVEADYPVFYGDSGACEGYALLTADCNSNSRIVVTVDYRLPEYCDDECDGSGSLYAVVVEDREAYGRLVAEKRLEQWRSALHDSLINVSYLLKASPLDPKDAMRALLEELLPREEEERLRFLDAVAATAVQELQEDSLRDWLERKAPWLARIEWVEEVGHNDAGSAYTYLESITLVAADGERFLLGSDDDPFWRCEQFQALDAEDAFGDEDPNEVFAARLSRKFGYEGDFRLLWNHIQSLVAVLRNQGVCGVELRPVEQKGADHAAA